MKSFFSFFLLSLSCTGNNPGYLSPGAEGTSAQEEVLPQKGKKTKEKKEKEKPSSPGVASKKGQECATCHAQVRALGEGKGFDVSGIYPQLDPNQFDDGKKIPVLIESLELAGLKKIARGKDVLEKVCTDCHLAHDSPLKDRIGIKERKQNLGLWVTLELIDNVLDVEIKFKSYNSAHRVPAGLASRAYVIVVEVFQQGWLDLWHGPKIAEPLRDGKRVAGLTLARFFVDENGKLTNDLSRVHSLLDDTRLEHQRFLGEHFLYKIDRDKKVEALARLYYLPAFPTWTGAIEVMVERAKREPH